MSNPIEIKRASAIGKYTLKRSEPKGVRDTPWGRFFPGQSYEGYGSKIVTDLMLTFEGEKRPRRVYATCFSNAASHWILFKGEKFFLNATDEVQED